MAEVVHKNLEAMLPQLEELEASGIFSREEVKTIVKFRRTHEYRMVRRPTHKEDFLTAIQYELHLDRLRKQRKTKLGVTKSRRDADYGIQNRIHGLFRRALKKFKGYLKLWMQYIDFAQKSHHKLSLSRIYGRALAIHPTAISLWVMAAKFQFEELKDVASARSLLQQGLRANTEAQLLWREYLRLELLYADKFRKRQEVLGVRGDEGEAEEEKMESSQDEVLAYKVPSVVFQQAIKAIPGDVEFRLSLLPIQQLFPDTASLQDEVYDSLKSDFPGHPLVWDAMARRPWVGVDTSMLKASQISDLERQSEQIYSEGLSSLKAERPDQEVDLSDEGVGSSPGREGVEPSSSTAALWECYFKWALERHEQATGFKSLKKRAEQRLTTTFKEAAEAGHLTVQTYLQYVSFLDSQGHPTEAKTVVNSAVRVHPTSVQLWLTRLGMIGAESSLSVNTGSKDDAGGSKAESRDVEKSEAWLKELESLCKRALKSIPDQDSLPVWQLWLEKALDLSDDPKAIESIFKSGMTSRCSRVSERLSGLYLEWAYKVGGLSKARKIYKKLLECPPVPYSLYEKCLSLEELGVTSGHSGHSLKKLRELFERAIRDHGKTEIEIWLRYIKAELNMEGGDLEMVGRLHWKATKELSPALVASFMEQYSLLYSPDTAPPKNC